MNAPMRRIFTHPAWTLASWVYLAIVGFLTVWVLLAMLLVGLRPVIVTSGSMSPALRPGDVVMVSQPDDVVAAGTIVTFNDTLTGDRITHRVVDVVDGSYVTAGDANPSPDAAAVPQEAISGVGRLVVPFAGLPMYWWSSGSYLMLMLWLAVTLGVIATLNATRATEEERAALAAENSAETGRMSAPGLRRVRLLAVALLAGQYVADSSHFDGGALISGGTLVAVVCAGFLLINVGSLFAERRIAADRLDIIEIAVDAGVVLVLMLSLQGSAVSWIALAVPVIGAVTRFRMTGALVLWGCLSLVLLGVRMLSIPSGGQEIVPSILALRETVEQLGIVLVVMVPGGYLLEQLVIEASRQRRAADDAERRSALLRGVAAGSQELTRLNTSAFDALGHVAHSLGYHEVAVLAAGPHGLPESKMSGAVPAVFEPVDLLLRANPRGAPGVAMTTIDTQMSVGTSVVLCDLTETSDPERLVLCIAVPSGELDENDTEAIELLASHARIALDNERLLASVTEMRDRMEEQSLTDVLTGLPNRLHFNKHLRDVLDHSGRRDRVALLFLDLDGFKAVNDSQGHDAGDALLEEVARRLTATCAHRGFVSRLGGDEFTVIAPDTDRGGATALAADVRHVIEQPISVNGVDVGVSASIGIAFAASNDLDDLVRRADLAMYDAKNNGRRQTRFYTSDLDAPDTESVDVEATS